ncbi:MAG: sortase [Candidatus Dojkabacteria bacterium]
MKLFTITTILVLVSWVALSNLPVNGGSIVTASQPAPITVVSEEVNNYGVPGISRGISVKAIPGSADVGGFYLEIPAIGLKKRVVPNVDPTRRGAYLPVIDENVAHGRYTRLPDQATKSGNVYLYAHRDGHAGFFNRLDELRNGAKIEIFYNGETFTYKVFRSFVVNRKDTWVYTAQSPSPTLTLQTCENGSEDRLIVKARLVRVV